MPRQKHTHTHIYTDTHCVRTSGTLLGNEYHYRKNPKGHTLKIIQQSCPRLTHCEHSTQHTTHFPCKHLTLNIVKRTHTQVERSGKFRLWISLKSHSYRMKAWIRKMTQKKYPLHTCTHTHTVSVLQAHYWAMNIFKKQKHAQVERSGKLRL